MWNGTMFVDLDWPLNASSLLSASAELLVFFLRLVTSTTIWYIMSMFNCSGGRGTRFLRLYFSEPSILGSL